MAAVGDFLHFPWERSPELIFDLVRPRDVKEVEAFIVDDYFGQLPLTAITGMNVEGEIQPWIGKYLGHVIEKNVSILVRDSSRDNRIVATAINNIQYKDAARDEMTMASFADAAARPCWTAICQLIDDLNRHVEFDQDPVLAFNFVGVAQDYGHRGLAKKLTDVAVRVAKGRNIKAVKNEVVNEYLANAMFEAGFVVAKQIGYQFYTRNGTKPFVTDSIHDKIRLMVKLIE